MTNPQDILATRYGKGKATSKGQRYAFIALGSALVLGFIGWAAYTSVANAGAPQSQMFAFTIVDAQHSTATFEVTASGSGKATCAIQAQAQDFSVVGYKEVKLDKVPSGRVTVTVNTTSEPVSVSIDRCW